MAKTINRQLIKTATAPRRPPGKRRRGFHPAANELIFEQRFRLLSLKSAKGFGSPGNIFPFRLSRNLKVARSHSPAGRFHR